MASIKGKQRDLFVPSHVHWDMDNGSVQKRALGDYTEDELKVITDKWVADVNALAAQQREANKVPA